MKKSTVFLLITYVMLFCFSCENSTKSSTEKLIDKLSATWYSQTEIAEFEITSNIEQTLFDIFNEGTGEITITGYFNAKMTLMMSKSGIIQLHSDFQNTEMVKAVFSEEIAMLQRISVDSTYEMYACLNPDFTYDSTLSKITINQTKLYYLTVGNEIEDSTKFIILNGELANNRYDLKIDEPTIIPFMTFENSSISITIEDDGTWKRTVHNDGIITKQFPGKWGIEQDSLYVYETDTSTGLIDTTVYEINIEEDNLVLNTAIKTRNDNFIQIENMYHLEPGSLSMFRFFITSTYTKTPMEFGKINQYDPIAKEFTFKKNIEKKKILKNILKTK